MNAHFRFGSFLTLLLLVTALAISGCNKTAPDTDTAGPVDSPSGAEPGATGDQNNITAETLRQIRPLSPEILATLAPKTEFPAQWIYPNAYYIKILAPGKTAGSTAAASLDKLLKANAASLPFINFCDNLDIVYVSEKSSFVSLTDPNSGNTLTLEYPIPARAVYLRSQTSIDPKKFTDFAFAGIPADQISEQTFGTQKVSLTKQSIMVPLDQEQKNVGQANEINVALAFPDANSAIMITGSSQDVEEYFTAAADADARGGLVQYLARIPVDQYDFMFLYDYNHPLAAMVPNIFPEQLGKEVAEGGDLVAMCVDSCATDGKNIMDLTIQSKSAEQVGKTQTALGSTLMFLADEAKKVAAMPNAGAGATMLLGLDEVLKKVQTEVVGNRLSARLPWSQETADFLTGAVNKLNDARDQAERMARYNGVAQQLGILSGAMTAAYGKDNVYPCDIRGTDGTPLLSWRVALLPNFGPEGEALYKEFKLDEAWNGPNNIKLLDKIPSIYSCILDPALKTKTTFQRFNSPNTPFGQYPDGLKTQQLPNPGKTFMIVSTSPELAVEWTQPESLVLDENNPEALVPMFGDYVAAVPFMGNVFLAPLSGKPEGLQTLINWITGNQPETATETPAAPAEAAPAEAAPAEVAPAPVETPAATPASGEPAL